MKKIFTPKVIALLVAVVLIATAVVAGIFIARGPNTLFTGPTLQVSLPGMPLSFDPMHAFRCQSGAAIVSMLYEGLYRHEPNGRVVPAMAQGWRTTRNDLEFGEYVIEITLRESRWTNGDLVTADHFLFAWRRLLDPANNSEAAVLLYQIRGARQVVTGEASIYNFGAAAVGTDVIEIEFDVSDGERPDIDMFLQALASPALVPLHRDSMERTSYWSTNAMMVESNGPFNLQRISYDLVPGSQPPTHRPSMLLERNLFYRRNIERHANNRFVTPFRIELNFTSAGRFEINGSNQDLRFGTSAELSYALFNYDLSKYTSGVPFANRDERGVNVVDTMNTHTYIFNTDNPLFADARVRRALSIALDRNELINSAQVHGRPAEGVVPPTGVFNTRWGRNATLFADARPNGSLISPTGDMAAARALLNQAGVTSGAFEILVRGWDAEALRVAEYVRGVWNSLGFTVTIRTEGFVNVPGATYNEALDGMDFTRDNFMNAYLARDWDVVALDMQTLSSNPLFALAPFSLFGSGSATVGLPSGQEYAPHISGWSYSRFDAQISRSFSSRDAAVRANYLHDAEAILMEQMPIIPLFVHQNVFQYSSDLRGIFTNWTGFTNFIRTNDRTFRFGREE